MSEVLKVLVPRGIAAPRGAFWASDAAVWLAWVLARPPAQRPRPSADATTPKP